MSEDTPSYPTPAPESAMASVDWKRVGLFYGIALGGAILVALLRWTLSGVPGQAGTLLATAITAVLYMPMPLVAALITERVAGRRYLIGEQLRAMRTRVWRTIGHCAAWATVIVLSVVVLGFAATALAGVIGVPGVGRIVTTDADLKEVLAGLSAAIPEGTQLPPVWMLLVATCVQGLIGGLTINTVFAFGEEYGWRGVLADALRPLGLAKASALTGVLWGLWHAPIIMLGHNYGAEWGWGIPMMVTWTVPLAFLLTWSRERTGSILAPSMLHGLYNALAGIFTLLLIGGQLLIALPVGILCAVVLSIIAVIVWHLPRRTNQTPRNPVSGG